MSQTTTSGASTGTETADESAGLYGTGIYVGFNGRAGIRADWTRDEDEIDFVSLSLSQRF